MYRLFLAIAFVCSAIYSQAQSPVKTPDQPKDHNMGFELVEENNLPVKWWGAAQTKGYQIITDTATKHSGNRSLLIEKLDPAHATNVGMSAWVIPAKYLGKEIEIRGYMKLEGVAEYASLSAAIDDEHYDRLKFVDMRSQKIRGTRDWKAYSVKFPLEKDARYIRIWPTLMGKGKVWFDDIQVLIDGKDISLAALKPDFNPTDQVYVPYGNNPAAGASVKVKYGEIYYETYGQGEPLLLLHGNSQSIVALKRQIIPLSAHYKVIAVDTRIQGKSTHLSDAPLSYDLFAEDMKTLMDSLKIPKANILGWSDGGNTGLIMAYKYPAYVNKLAVMGAVMYPTEEAVFKSILTEINKAIVGLKKQTDPQSQAKLKLFTLLVTEPHISVENLQQIKAPVLVMAGEKDMVVDKHTRHIAASLPLGQLLIFKGATHYAPVEIPAEYNKQVMSFFNK